MHRHFWKVSVDGYGDYVFTCLCGSFYEVFRKHFWKRTPVTWRQYHMFHFRPNPSGIYVKPATPADVTLTMRLRRFFRG